MNSSTDWPAATVQYRLNVAHALYSVSPTLSALHASRAAALHPEISTVLQPSHCLKCGTYHFSGDHPSHLVGPSTRKKRRLVASLTLRRRCHVCGFSIDAHSLDHSSVLNSALSNAATVQTISWARDIDQELPSNDILLPTAPVETTKCMRMPSLPRQQSHPKPNYAKTSTLKDLISRDRQREEGLKSQKKKREGHEGLAAFLKQL